MIKTTSIDFSWLDKWLSIGRMNWWNNKSNSIKYQLWLLLLSLININLRRFPLHTFKFRHIYVSKVTWIHMKNAMNRHTKKTYIRTHIYTIILHIRDSIFCKQRHIYIHMFMCNYVSVCDSGVCTHFRQHSKPYDNLDSTSGTKLLGASRPGPPANTRLEAVWK